MTIQNSSPILEPKQPVLGEEALILKVSSQQKSELKNSPSPQQHVTNKEQGLKLRFANAQPVTVKKLKLKDMDADNRPKVFLQIRLKKLSNKHIIYFVSHLLQIFKGRNLFFTNNKL